MLTLTNRHFAQGSAHTSQSSELPLSSTEAPTPPVQFLDPTEHGDQNPETIHPLATHIKAWEAIPGVSEWVLSTVRQGYSVEFTRCPLRFQAWTATNVNTEVVHLLCTQIVSFVQFLVPKKDGALKPILDLRHLN